MPCLVQHRLRRDDCQLYTLAIGCRMGLTRTHHCDGMRSPGRRWFRIKYGGLSRRPVSRNRTPYHSFGVGRATDHGPYSYNRIYLQLELLVSFIQFKFRLKLTMFQVRQRRVTVLVCDRGPRGSYRLHSGVWAYIWVHIPISHDSGDWKTQIS